MALERYRGKRDFTRSPEPSGSPAPGEGRTFVVQKHDARQLHYDLRLELDGVLKSWAVPKGPSLDPDQRRLAVHVEDHPIEYGDFEGVIPKGEYGAGPVMLWDRGVWEPEGDARRGYEKGHLRFNLAGHRLRGRWSLVRTKGDEVENEDKNWLLIKGNDEYVADEEATARFDRSITTDRSMEEIAAGKPARRSRAALAPPPEWLPPQLATAVDKPPEGEQWLHEIKLDGYRTLCRIHDGRATLFSRSGKDWTTRFRALARALEELPVAEAWLDGEVAVLNPEGISSFPALQRALSEDRQEEMAYFLFDLLYQDGRELGEQPLLSRKEQLFQLLEQQAVGSSPLRYCDHIVGSGVLVFEEACRLGLEGIVSKRADGRYVGRRTREWQKSKCLNRQEFVIGGYTAPRGARKGFGALLVGYYEGERLRFAGRVGTGFDEQTLADVYDRLVPLTRPECPFTERPPSGRTAVHWIAPRLVAEVAFAGWTGDGLLRMASFQGLREDKPARQVERERTAAQEAPAPPEPSRKPSPLPRTVAGLRLSNPDKVLWAGQGVTKRQLASYYESVGEAMLAELSGRPLTLLRCPNGRHGDCFFQKHANDTVPSAIKRVSLTEKGKEGIYMYVDSLAGIIGLVQLGVLEIHTWGARFDRPERPDRLIFDLDPGPGVPWRAVVDGAYDVRGLLEELGLQSFVRTTGGKGLHIVVPLVRRHGWNEVKEFTRACAEALARIHRGKYTARMAKSAREGRIYIDYLRNDMGATAICNYSTRAREGAPVAVPVSWAELSVDLDPQAFSVTTVPPLMAERRNDPWPDFYALRQSLSRPMRRRLGLD